VITNITREHFDYHKTMEKYRKAKLKLFEKVKIAIINLDMENPEEFLRCGAENMYGYSTKIYNFQFPISNKIENKNDKFENIIAENISLGIKESEFKIKNFKFKIFLPGLFNIENALAAACVGLSQGISQEVVSQALEKIKGIPGRMEYVPNDRGLNIIIDYAVTPDSLEKLYTLIKEINTSNNKIIAVFGSCGERDRGKRAIMGEIVSNIADYIVLTNEDPYGEDPKRIIDELASGVKNKIENKNFWKIMERREAIKKALLSAKPGDYIIVTGKGAEETMAVRKERIPWNDKKVILEELAKL
jgi:UDP-N-acetylmuramoyl-L-alanyl-D-glutamate--2,6-diaminopimelate ligase